MPLGVEGGRVHRKTLRKEGPCSRGSRCSGLGAKEDGIESSVRAKFTPGPEPDIQDLGMEYRVVLAVPNVCTSDIRVDVSRNLLAISSIGCAGERHPLLGMQIPDGVATDYITAELAGVILNVVLPKAKPRLIRVGRPEDHSGRYNGAYYADIAGDWLFAVAAEEIRLLRPLPPPCWGQDAVKVEILGNRITVSGPDGVALDGFRVPKGIAHERIAASYKEGVLTVVLPKEKSCDGPQDPGGYGASHQAKEHGVITKDIKMMGDIGIKNSDGS